MNGTFHNCTFNFFIKWEKVNQFSRFVNPGFQIRKEKTKIFQVTQEDAPTRFGPCGP